MINIYKSIELHQAEILLVCFVIISIVSVVLFFKVNV